MMESLNARTAVDRYISVRHRLPAARSPATLNELQICNSTVVGRLY